LSINVQETEQNVDVSVHAGRVFADFSPSLLFVCSSPQVRHRRQHQRDGRPGEETGHPVQRPHHQHDQVVLHLLRPGVRGERGGHHHRAGNQGEVEKTPKKGRQRLAGPSSNQEVGSSIPALEQDT